MIINLPLNSTFSTMRFTCVTFGFYILSLKIEDVPWVSSIPSLLPMPVTVLYNPSVPRLC